jgi:hypothetical protein
VVASSSRMGIAYLVMLYRWFLSILKAITIIRPETLCAGIGPGFAGTGGGNPVLSEVEKN